MKNVLISLLALLPFISCDRKPGHHENDSSFSDFPLITETGEIEIRDLNNDGFNDIITIGIDNNGKRVAVDSLFYNPDSTPFSNLELLRPNLIYEEITIDDFVTYGVNGLDREGNPEMYLYVEDSLVSYSEWINRKKKVTTDSWFERNYNWIIPEN